MSLKQQRAREWMRKRQRMPKREFPLATMVYYGPDDQRATKLAVALIENDGEEPGVLNRWMSDEGDIRHNDQVLMEAVQWLKAHAVQRVLVVDRILGCPHEEGIDYPEGEPCPLCLFWADRDRFTGELMGDTVVHTSDEDSDDMPVTYSSHCQVVERDGVTLDVQIYRIPVSDWVLEVVNENNTSFVWDDAFDNDADAWAEFQRTLREEGLEGFADDE